MAAPKPLTKLTSREYLEIERLAEFKSELFDGEMFAMAGGTPDHSLIATNLARETGNSLKGRPCVPYNADLRVMVEATGLFTYPDLSVVCGPLEFPPDADDTIINPTVIIEVLSDSTEAYDRGKKFEHYRKIRSLKEYVLVSQKEPKAEVFTRQPDGRWLLSEASGLGAKLELTSLGITLAFEEIFANVKFASSSLRAGTPPAN